MQRCYLQFQDRATIPLTNSHREWTTRSRPDFFVFNYWLNLETLFIFGWQETVIVLLHQQFIFIGMGGKKKGGFKEPDVEVPPGDPAVGKGIFEDQCSVCHAMDVSVI